MKLISFNPEFKPLILDGRKTQTRRLVKPQPDVRCDHAYQGDDGVWRFARPTPTRHVSLSAWDVRCPYGRVGSKLKVNGIDGYLEITNIRVERLQDISETDARAEGMLDGGCLNCGNSSYSEPCGCDNPEPSHRDAFIFEWSKIYGWTSWIENPWVWCITFKVVQPAQGGAV